MSSTVRASGFCFQYPPGISPPRPLRLRVRHREEVKRWKKRHPEKARELARRNYSRHRAKFCAKSRKQYRQKPEIRLRSDLLKRYNLTIQAFRALLASQKGLCAICGESEKGRFSRLSVDHDHETKAIRGLLCSACNSGLGRFKDKEELLVRALEYLRNAKIAPKS